MAKTFSRWSLAEDQMTTADLEWTVADVTALERCLLWKRAFPKNKLEVVSCKSDGELFAFIRREEDVGIAFVNETEDDDSKPDYWYLRVVAIEKFRKQYKITEEIEKWQTTISS